METWDARKTIGALAVAAAIAGFGGSAIAAATDSGPGAGSAVVHGGGGPPGAPAPHRQDVEPGSLHGENVVADGRGGFQTLMSQTGRVTAVTATSVTARSDDGYVQTHVIHEAGATSRPPWHVGDQVVIDAIRVGGTAVVTTMRPPF